MRLAWKVESRVWAKVKPSAGVVSTGSGDLRGEIAQVVLSAFEFNGGTEWLSVMITNGDAFVLRFADIGSPEGVHHVLSVGHRTKVCATIVEAIAIRMIDLSSLVQSCSAENNEAVHINRKAARMRFRVTSIS
jgi:hypothetical protein